MASRKRGSGFSPEWLDGMERFAFQQLWLDLWRSQRYDATIRNGVPGTKMLNFRKASRKIRADIDQHQRREELWNRNPHIRVVDFTAEQARIMAAWLAVMAEVFAAKPHLLDEPKPESPEAQEERASWVGIASSIHEMWGVFAHKSGVRPESWNRVARMEFLSALEGTRTAKPVPLHETYTVFGLLWLGTAKIAGARFPSKTRFLEARELFLGAHTPKAFEGLARILDTLNIGGVSGETLRKDWLEWSRGGQRFTRSSARRGKTKVQEATKAPLSKKGQNARKKRGSSPKS